MTTIKRRDFLQLTVLSLAALALPRTAQAAEGKRPNILLILSDDHSAPHVGCYGNKDIITPNLDKFAAQGLRFDRTYVCCPQCVPSRASIMTGRSPVEIQMTRFSAPLPRDIKTYPEALRAAGYFTGVCGRSYHLDGANFVTEIEDFIEKHHLKTFPDRLDYVKISGQQEAFGEMQEFLGLAKDKPWFLQLCFSDPHRKLDRNDYSARYNPAKLTLPKHYPDTPAVRDDLSRYYGEITRLDELFGKIMDELNRRGLAENTLVAFMGDNGCSQFRGKGTLYELGLHVPLLMRWPGRIKAGSATSELVSGEDLAPTFLSAAGVAVPPEMTGRSFLPAVLGEKFTGRPYVFGERGSHASGLPGTSNAFDIGRCVISRTHKLIYNGLWQIPYKPVDFSGDKFWKELEAMHTEGKLAPELDKLYFAEQRPIFELYDLVNDPAEMQNLYDQPEVQQVQRELIVALSEWMILQRDFLPLPAAALKDMPKKKKKHN